VERPDEVGLAFLSYGTSIACRVSCMHGFWDWFTRDLPAVVNNAFCLQMDRLLIL
jgi:hypothetical protein